MSYDVIQGTAEVVSRVLNGAVTLSGLLPAGLYVGGRTLIFTNPSVVVTFPGTSGGFLPFATIIATLHTEIPDLGAHVTQTANPGITTTRHASLVLNRASGFAITGTGSAARSFMIPADGVVSYGAINPARIASTSVASSGNITLILLGADYVPPTYAVWRTGSGAPDNALGKNGDFYLDVMVGSVYERLAGTYQLQGNIKGPEGPQGVQASYLHVQTVSSASWTVSHNLGYRPVVEVYDTGGVEVICDVIHLSTNVLVVRSAAPFTGHVRLT